MTNWIYEAGEKWGLHVAEVSGVPLSIMRIGVGSSEVGVLEEVLSLNRVKIVLFFGLCGGVGEDVGPRDFAVPTGAICEEGLA